MQRKCQLSVQTQKNYYRFILYYKPKEMLLLLLLTILARTSHPQTLPLSQSYISGFPQDTSPLPKNGLYIVDPLALGITYGNAMVPLKHVDYTLEIVNTLSHVTLKQQYQNPLDKFLNVYFSFPIDPQAAIYKLTAQFGTKVIQAVVKQKNQAKKQYEKAKNSGGVALLSAIDPNSRDIFRMNIGNIPPKTKLIITIKFVQEMTLSVSSFYRAQISSSVCPRYMNQVPQSEVKKGQTNIPLLIDNNTKISRRSDYTWNFKIILKSYQEITYFNSSTHKLKKIFQNENKKQIHLILEQMTIPQKDFVFLYSTKQFNTPSYTMGTSVNQASTAHVSFVPKFTNVKNSEQAQKYIKSSQTPEIKLDAVKGEFIFILDRSGSMDAIQRIQKAKKSLIVFLKSLPLDSYFNVISFGKYYQPLYEQSQKYQQTTINDAIGKIQQMLANMKWTQIYQPIYYALGIPEIAGYPRFLFILSDGQVSKAEKIINMIKKNTRAIRVNSIGFGNGASLAFIRGVAEAGKGKYVMVTDDDDPTQKITNLLESALTPLITKFNLKYDKSLVQSIIPNPQEMPYILKDDILNFYLMFKDKLKQKTKVIFQYQDTITNKLYSQELQINPNRQTYVFVDKMARFNVLKVLQDVYEEPVDELSKYLIYKQKSSNNTLKQQIQLYSIQHQILSQHTSLVAVSKQLTDKDKQLFKQVGSQSVLIAQPMTKQYLNRMFSQNLIISPIAGTSTPDYIQTNYQNDTQINKKVGNLRGNILSDTSNITLVNKTDQIMTISELPKQSQEIKAKQALEKKKLQQQRLKKVQKTKLQDLIVLSQKLDGRWNNEQIIKQILQYCKCQKNFDLKLLQKSIRKDVIITRLTLQWIWRQKLQKRYSLLIRKAQQWLKDTIAAQKIDEKLLNSIKFD